MILSYTELTKEIGSLRILATSKAMNERSHESGEVFTSLGMKTRYPDSDLRSTAHRYLSDLVSQLELPDQDDTGKAQRQ